jgi:hypothetical protein
MEKIAISPQRGPEDVIEDVVGTLNAQLDNESLANSLTPLETQTVRVFLQALPVLPTKQLVLVGLTHISQDMAARKTKAVVPIFSERINELITQLRSEELQCSFSDMVDEFAAESERTGEDQGDVFLEKLIAMTDNGKSMPPAHYHWICLGVSILQAALDSTVPEDDLRLTMLNLNVGIAADRSRPPEEMFQELCQEVILATQSGVAGLRDAELLFLRRFFEACLCETEVDRLHRIATTLRVKSSRPRKLTLEINIFLAKFHERVLGQLFFVSEQPRLESLLHIITNVITTFHESSAGESYEDLTALLMGEATADPVPPRRPEKEVRAAVRELLLPRAGLLEGGATRLVEATAEAIVRWPDLESLHVTLDEGLEEVRPSREASNKAREKLFELMRPLRAEALQMDLGSEQLDDHLSDVMEADPPPDWYSNLYQLLIDLRIVLFHPESHPRRMQKCFNALSETLEDSYLPAVEHQNLVTRRLSEIRTALEDRSSILGRLSVPEKRLVIAVIDAFQEGAETTEILHSLLRDVYPSKKKSFTRKLAAALRLPLNAQGASPETPDPLGALAFVLALQVPKKKLGDTVGKVQGLPRATVN